MNLLIDNMLFYGMLFFALVSCVSMAGQNIAAILLLLGFVLKIMMDKKRLIPFDDHLIRGIALFFVTAAISAIFAVNKQTSMDVWFNYLYRFSIFFVPALFIRTRKQVQWILIALAISISISDLYAIGQWLNGTKRVSAFFSHPMILAGCLMIIIPNLFMQVIYNREQRFIFIPALMISLFTLLINQTRGAWIALGITAIIGCIFLRQHRKQMIIYVTALLLLLLCFFYLNPQIMDRFQTIFDMQRRSHSERMLLWNSAIQMIKDYPVTGIGLGNFREQYITKYISPFAKEPNLAHAHNNVLHIFAETGILGGVAFLYMFFMVFKKCYSYITSIDSWKSGVAISGILMTSALFLQGITEYNFGHSVVIRLFWFVLGVIFASLKIDEDFEKKSPPI